MNEIHVSWNKETWNNLFREEKSQYTMPKNDVDEKVHVSDTDNDSNVQPFNTRCTPTQFYQMMSTFSHLQKDAVLELGFGNLLMLNCGFLRPELCAWLVNKFDTTTLSIELHGKSFKLNPSVMGIFDKGDIIYIDGAIHDSRRTKFFITNRGIKLLHFKDLLKNNKTADDDFKVRFCLHMLGTVLAPAAEEYVNARFLNVLTDMGNINGKNWARWCFDQLVISIDKFQSKSARYIGGCVLFLEVSNSEYTQPAAPSDNSDKAKHDIPPDDVLHMVVEEIQQLRTEYADLKHKEKRTMIMKGHGE
ncbi:hypothetical protein Dsin_025008 [Dipteronia sinensis]|uniref:Uncharacterized protein n=1 Tax=Dipteronia sinensis TaxID=43782 RepID=A0AAE0DWQ0_9ROSI|nr:hypothetical protein Dsin_025008 [Dipteronia sinensis]